MKKTPHQKFTENLRKQVKHNRDHCRRPLRACSSDQADCEEDDELSEEELQRLLEQKFDELFGTTDGNDEED